MFIRAVNGHSMDSVRDELLFEQLTVNNLPPVCVHGTFRSHFRAICSTGLRAGGGRGLRSHIHFQAFEPGDNRCVSGMRHNCEVALYINLKQAIRDGIPLYLTANGVVVTRGRAGVLPPEYFTEARDLQTGMKMSFPL